MKIEFGVNLQQVLFTTGQNSILRDECGKSSSIFYSTKNTFAFYFSIQKQNIALRELGNSVNKKVGCNLESTEIRQKVQRSDRKYRDQKTILCCAFLLYSRIQFSAHLILASFHNTITEKVCNH